MVIEIGDLLNKAARSTCSINMLNPICSSVVYTSIVLSVLVILIMIIINPSKSEGSAAMGILKMFLYVFIFTLIILFLHSSTIKSNYKKKYLNNNVDNFITKMHNSRDDPIYNKSKVSVVPDTKLKDLQKTGGEEDESNKNKSISEIINNINNQL